MLYEFSHPITKGHAGVKRTREKRNNKKNTEVSSLNLQTGFTKARLSDEIERQRFVSSSMSYTLRVLQS